jgi:carboxylesterase
MKQKWKKRMRRLIVLLIAAALLYTGCLMLTEQLIDRADRNMPRDPETGLLEDAAPRSLGPEESPRAILLVHGFLGSGQNLGALPAALADEGWRVRVMLLPGHGTSPRDLRHVAAEELRAAVREELNALLEQHETVAVGGHSMGGSLATLAAAEAPVDALVLIAPYFGVSYRWYYLLPPERWMRLAEPVLPWVPKTRAFVQVNRPEAKDEVISYRWMPMKAGVVLAELGEEASKPSTLQQITCPVLLMHSRQDVAASAEASERAFEQMPSDQKRLLWFNDSNHILLFDYDRGAVIRAIVEFLDGLGEN